MKKLDSNFPINEATSFADLLATLDQLAEHTIDGKPIANLESIVKAIKLLVTIPLTANKVENIKTLMEVIPEENGLKNAVIECYGTALKEFLATE